MNRLYPKALCYLPDDLEVEKMVQMVITEYDGVKTEWLIYRDEEGEITDITPTDVDVSNPDYYHDELNILSESFNAEAMDLNVSQLLYDLDTGDKFVLWIEVSNNDTNDITAYPIEYELVCNEVI